MKNRATHLGMKAEDANLAPRGSYADAVREAAAAKGLALGPLEFSPSQLRDYAHEIEQHGKNSGLAIHALLGHAPDMPLAHEHQIEMTLAEALAAVENKYTADFRSPLPQPRILPPPAIRRAAFNPLKGRMITPVVLPPRPRFRRRWRFEELAA